MSKVTTKTGDKGTTSLYSGERVSKASSRIETIGSMDELQAFLGLARSYISDTQMNDDVAQVEKFIFSAMEEVATLGSEPLIKDEDIEWMENKIAEYSPAKFSFQLPGANTPSATMHVARCVARRCERNLHRLAKEDDVSQNLMAFLNRVSDLCYCMACKQS